MLDNGPYACLTESTVPMSSFMRPEARKALSRYRDLIIAAVFVVIGLRWGLTSFGILSWIGWLLVVAGAAFAWSGIQRIRFHANSQGAGVVHVKEGQITYFGPFAGGVVAITELRELILDRTIEPGHWILRQHGQEPVLIPVDSEGADALFDVFAALPGLNTESMLAALKAPAGKTNVIWQRQKAGQNVPRLH